MPRKSSLRHSQEDPAMETKATPSARGMKKREQIQHTNKLVFLWVAGAAVAVTVALVLSQFLVRQLIFNDKIISALNTSNTTLKNDIQSYGTLKNEVVKLLANPKLSDLRINKDAGGDNALQVVIDAMPTNDDRIALAASLQQAILSRSGVRVDQLTFTDTANIATPAEMTGAAASTGNLSEIPFTFKATGTYDQLKKMFADIQLSIRPVSVSNVKLSGANDTMTAEVQASTYYATPMTTDLTKGTVQP